MDIDGVVSRSAALFEDLHIATESFGDSQKCI
jgi:hypothetical protein